MKTTTKKLKEAIMLYREQTTNCFDVEASARLRVEIQAFIELYNMLGETELYDGIATAMQDAGYDEAYEEIMSLLVDEIDEIDDIIKESGE